MDKNEQKLTEAEKRRLEHFEKTSEEMVRQGYVRQDLTVDIRKANRFGIFLMFPLLIIGYGLYYLIHRRMEFAASSLLIFLLAFFGCIVLHELIHGLSWSIFTPRHFKDVEFGVMRSSLTPYCACTVPLKRHHHTFLNQLQASSQYLLQQICQEMLYPNNSGLYIVSQLLFLMYYLQRQHENQDVPQLFQLES